MSHPDTYVIEMEYDDARGNRTRRVVSPIRFMGSYRFLGLCLCREQPRQFQLARCRNVRLIPAHEVSMPMPMQSMPTPVATAPAPVMTPAVSTIPSPVVSV